MASKRSVVDAAEEIAVDHHGRRQRAVAETVDGLSVNSPSALVSPNLAPSFLRMPAEALGVHRLARLGATNLDHGVGGARRNS
jgi:hypothetical protein